MRVKFEGEDGSGPGVNRGFFASLANALKNNDMVSNIRPHPTATPTLVLHVGCACETNTF